MKFFTYFFIIFERLCCLQLNFIIILYGILIYFLAKCPTLFGTQLFTVHCTAVHCTLYSVQRNTEEQHSRREIQKKLDTKLNVPRPCALLKKRYFGIRVLKQFGATCQVSILSFKNHPNLQWYTDTIYFIYKCCILIFNFHPGLSNCNEIGFKTYAAMYAYNIIFLYKIKFKRKVECKVYSFAYCSAKRRGRGTGGLVIAQHAIL